MNLRQLITQLLQNKVVLSKRDLILILDIPPQSLTENLIILLNMLLNKYNQIYFIVLKGMPPCLLPGAYRQTSYTRQDGLTYKRIDSCSSCSLKRQCPGWCPDLSISPQQSKPIADIPSEIALEITGQCNLSCSNCTNATKNTQHLSFKTVQKILDDARRCQVPDIRFTGGEPLLNPELPDMLAYAKSCGLYVMLNTNATLITPSWLRIFSGSVDNVLISLQGFNEASDNALTNSPEPFLKKIHNILLLRSTIPTLRIGTVITPTLLANWPQYAALIKQIQPHTWALFRPMNGNSRDKYHINQKDYQRLAMRILILNQEGVSTKIANALPFCAFPGWHLAASTLLGALSDDGNSRLIWDMRGFFKPSYFIDKKLGLDIKIAWKHPFLRKLKKNIYLPAECRTCPFWHWCRGGSRVMACNTYKTYFAPDPWFNKKVARQAALYL